LLGTFVKTPHPAVVEILGLSELDCICIDAEHAPFDRGSLDMSVLAARAGNFPALVRVSRADPAEMLNALDLGATGVLIPHITTAAAAAAAVMSCRYKPGGRGYAGSTRAARYSTRSLADNIERANTEVTVVAQIEDAEALNNIDAIAGVEGIDALFIGRMDLTVSLGAGSPMDPVVLAAVTAICASARRAGRVVGMFTPTIEETHRWFDAGATLFLLGSDQQFILHGARDLRAVFDRPVKL
jgi:2-keto-3-deoxy-L-rhamnonate aldolase RhmA